jgi:hypothetical protein
MRDEGTQTLRDTSSTLVLGSFLIAVLNLFSGSLRPGLPAPPRQAASPVPGSGNGEPAASPRHLEEKFADPALRRN